MAPWWKFWDRRPAEQLGQLEPPKPLPEEPPSPGVVAVMAPLGEGSTRHPGWGLELAHIRGAFVHAEGGFPALQCDVFEDIVERDAHLRSQVESRTKAVAGKGWILQAGGDDQADADAARALELALRRIPNVHHAWQHLLSANFYGYAPVEIAWDYVDGLFVPVKLACVPHRRIRFHPETDEPTLLTSENMLDGEPLRPGKWIFASLQHRKTVRAGLLRTAVWWSWLKSLSVRDWQIFCSRFGIPFVLGVHDLHANEEVIKRLTQAITAFGQNGGAVLPKGTQIEVKETSVSGNTSSVHPGLVELCDRQISKLILGGTLLSDQGTTGSYGQGAVHAQQAFALAMADDAELANWVSTQLGTAFVKYNGLQARPPRLKHRVVPEMDPEKRMKIYSAFVNELGGEVDADQVRDEFDIKKVTGEALKGAPKPAPGGGAGDDAPADDERAAA
jgi:phage gp29-like protein